jgi:septal ring factor EnvC (AmiA/AmiB activator)
VRARAKEAERGRREQALRDLERRAAESSEASRKLASELERLRADSTGLASALVGAARRSQAAETRVREIEAGLETIVGSEASIRRSLDDRREVTAEVLAALQRLGRSAAPAVLVHPADILSAIRSAILLGAVVPGLREEVERLAGDLAELVRLREIETTERTRLTAELALLRQEDERLDALVRLRRGQLAATEASLRRSGPAAPPGRPGENFEGTRGSARGRTRCRASRCEAERRRAEAEARQLRERFAAAASRDPVRLAPKIPFAETRGTVARPLTGPLIKDFGAPDGQGGTLRGVVIGGRPKGLVTARPTGPSLMPARSGRLDDS